MFAMALTRNAIRSLIWLPDKRGRNRATCLHVPMFLVCPMFLMNVQTDLAQQPLTNVCETPVCPVSADLGMAPSCRVVFLCRGARKVG